MVLQNVKKFPGVVKQIGLKPRHLHSTVKSWEKGQITKHMEVEAQTYHLYLVGKEGELAETFRSIICHDVLVRTIEERINKYSKIK